MKYISDYLVSFFDAEMTAKHIADRWTEMLLELPIWTRNLVSTDINWGSRKCMVLPPVWLFAAARDRLDYVLEDLRPSQGSWLAIGLSTSVVDDLVDAGGGNESRVALFYLLLAATLPLEDGQRARTLSLLSTVVPAFVPTGMDSPTDAKGVRIAVFHRLIMEELCSNIDLSVSDRSRLCKAAYALGSWCALLDDILDILIDSAQSTLRTRPLEILEALRFEKENLADEAIQLLHIEAKRRFQRVITLVNGFPGYWRIERLLDDGRTLVDRLVRDGEFMNLVQIKLSDQCTLK